MKCERFLIDHSKGKCRFCNNLIESGSDVFMIYQLKISPNLVKIFFHTECFEKIVNIFNTNTKDIVCTQD